MVRSNTVKFVVIISVLISLSVGGIFAQDGGHGHGEHEGESRPEIERESPIPLNVEAASEIGFVYQAFPSPQQQGGDEEDAPRFFPEQFLSSEPSTPREDRPSRAHAVLEFTNDLSRAYLHVQLINVDPESIEMFHLHCGRPAELGPIIVDVGLMGDVSEYFEDGMLTIEITNADIEAVIDSGEGILGVFSFGCPINAINPNVHVVTIGGMEEVARKGELYFNLHTSNHTFFGEARGAFYPVDMNE
ncbi:MAG: CHRD domain-containing protein [Chloroflexota bacterium]